MDSQHEKWFESRRVWAAVLTAISIAIVAAFPDNYELISIVASALAGVLGLTSWTMPKKQ